MADHPLALLATGFVLTTVLGGALGHHLQQRAWRQQSASKRQEREVEAAVLTFEEVSVLLDRRLYRMRQLVLWTRMRADGVDAGGFAAALVGYRQILEDWNDNLNRLLALVRVSFGQPLRLRLGQELHETYSAIGRELEWFMKEVAGASPGERVPVRRIDRRLNNLSGRVYDFNVSLLEALEREEVGGRRDDDTAVPWEPPLVRFGVRGEKVRALQRALAEEETRVETDADFGIATERALMGYQSIKGLTVDGIAGSATLRSLGLQDSGEASRQ